MKPITLILSTCLLIGCTLGIGKTIQTASPADDGSATEQAVEFEKDGRLRRPRGYRRWIFVGAPVTPNDLNGGRAAFPEFHSVYIDPASYEAYKRTGRWRDGTVLLKELSTVGTKTSSSGKGYFMGEFTGLEAAVKSAERFPAEPGYWGFFRFTDEEGGPVRDLAAVLPTSSCATCHQSTAADDSVFTQHYPVLREAKAFGDADPEDR